MEEIKMKQRDRRKIDDQKKRDEVRGMKWRGKEGKKRGEERRGRKEGKKGGTRQKSSW